MYFFLLEPDIVPHRLGVCTSTTKFDSIFFGVNPKLAPYMDPLARYSSEKAFEAIMDAGVNPRKLKGSNVAVFTSTSMSESEKTIFNSELEVTFFKFKNKKSFLLRML